MSGVFNVKYTVILYKYLVSIFKYLRLLIKTSEAEIAEKIGTSRLGGKLGVLKKKRCIQARSNYNTRRVKHVRNLLLVIKGFK